MYNKKTAYRSLSDYEQQIVDRLLDTDFPGRGELREQIRNCLVRTIDENGSLEFEIFSSARAAVIRRIPIEGEVEDVDRVLIHILLHVVDGKVKEREIYKDDSSSTIKKFDPSEIRNVLLG